ncbi:MAG TPA: hypothetical protein VHB77_01820 [Planctomycetaceae bacterium]|nr:hypothetical protein [Planctomycetaceae bacterium]
MIDRTPEPDEHETQPPDGLTDPNKLFPGEDALEGSEGSGRMIGTGPHAHTTRRAEADRMRADYRNVEAINRGIPHEGGGQPGG